MSLAGRLEDLALADIFQILSIGKKTGTFLVKGTKGTALIVFKNGLVVRAETDVGTKKEETFVVGDRLETDIAAGQAVGCPSALVLSGVSTKVQADEWMPKIDIIADDLASLIG